VRNPQTKLPYPVAIPSSVSLPPLTPLDHPHDIISVKRGNDPRRWTVDASVDFGFGFDFDFALVSEVFGLIALASTLCLVC